MNFTQIVSYSFCRCENMRLWIQEKLILFCTMQCKYNCNPQFFFYLFTFLPFWLPFFDITSRVFCHIKNRNRNKINEQFGKKNELQNEVNQNITHSNHHILKVSDKIKLGQLYNSLHTLGIVRYFVVSYVC